MSTIISKRHIFLGVFVMMHAFLFSQVSSDYKSSKPKAGEGLHSFLIRHDLAPKEHQSVFIELNKGKFGKNNSLLAHHSYLIPNTEVELYEPLYGRERERFPLESSKLKGSSFYLVTGHGGPDPGAIGKYGNHELHEDEYAYDITLRLAKKLQENGAKVHLVIQDEDDGIRDNQILRYDNHETCGNKQIPLDQNKRLKQRALEVNKLYKQDTETYRRCLIIHLDSRSKRKQIDVFFYHHKKSKSGKKLAYQLRDTFDEKYKRHQPSRGFSGTVSDRNLYVLRNTTPVSVFVELGNIQNFRDQQRFVKSDNRQALANWLYDGIKKDFERKNKK
ncbi:N-acetylmuramoyl-L-alanine amidase family protein [Carboxylicivirga marina]|uniref:N-acetylmuramoyl-L-alanine amidase n=1 Tax=Carboxylicivirga marina TaxID=2800988 RepID=A0ABS1HPM4_9BACT|nr:N-acetylmuramoyl-L-alanine amidase [Carboxylicivirga marina]MBK3519632.1 N-acetylmuramoyl-L-alanine amidase [Carboxylicivirga marina]